MLGTILIVILILALLGALPRWSHSRDWGYAPTGGVGLYIKSINTTVDQYRAFLEEVRTDTLVLPNCDFDSGQATKPAEYALTDDSYAKLLARMSERRFDLTTADLRANILDSYSDLSVPIETKKDQARWQDVLKSLDQLKSVTPNATVADSPAQRSLSAPKTRVATPTKASLATRIPAA